MHIAWLFNLDILSTCISTQQPSRIYPSQHPYISTYLQYIVLLWRVCNIKETSFEIEIAVHWEEKQTKTVERQVGEAFFLIAQQSKFLAMVRSIFVQQICVLPFKIQELHHPTLHNAEPCFCIMLQF